jgi:hypothetical protein
MSNIDSMIEEISSDLRKYDDAGLIDKNKVYKDIVFALKKFGNDVSELTEVVLEVNGGKALLPDNFFSMRAAYLCEPSHYKNNGVSNAALISSHFFIERTSRESSWNECNTCCEKNDIKVVKENLYFDGGNIEFSFKNPVLLKLGKSIRKDTCHKSCLNFNVSNPNEIIIVGDTIQANFDSGYIYLQYYGFPSDEDGNIDIPETPNGELEMYIEYFCKRRLAERLIGNNDAQGLSNLYQVFRQEEAMRLKKASHNLKMTKIRPKELYARMKRINKLESLSYEISNL